jgi:sigma-E factor negative regulatory protein RseA
MNKVEQQKEQLSVLMDDIKLDSLNLDDVAHDDELKDTWSRMHLVRSVLHDELVSSESMKVSQRVMSALENEPSLSKESVTQPTTSNVIKMPSIWKQVSGFAIAASVCSVVIFGVQEQGESFTPGSMEIADKEYRSTLSPIAQRAVAPVSLQSRSYEEVQRDRMRKLYAEHLKKSRYYGVQPTMPYVKLVNIEPVLVKKADKKTGSDQ